MSIENRLAHAGRRDGNNDANTQIDEAVFLETVHLMSYDARQAVGLFGEVERMSGRTQRMDRNAEQRQVALNEEFEALRIELERGLGENADWRRLCSSGVRNRTASVLHLG